MVRQKITEKVTATEALLEVSGLTIGFGQPDGSVAPVVSQASLSVAPGECVGLVGESGCGKSLTALAILGLLPRNARLLGGRVDLAGAGDLLAAPERYAAVRGRRIAAVFQEPGAALNPVLTLGAQMSEVLQYRRGLSRTAARKEALRLFDLVAMPDASSRLRAYPHQLSGGQKQRAVIALALACEPELLLADEPTTALDVTVQSQILDLLAVLRSELGLAVLLITHDLGVVSQVCDRLVVMYCGRVMEESPVDAFFAGPQHPYSRLLLESVPRLGKPLGIGIPGRVPDVGESPGGCVFHPRCPEVLDACRQDEPDWTPIAPARGTRCWLASEEDAERMSVR